MKFEFCAENVILIDVTWQRTIYKLIFNQAYEHFPFEIFVLEKY